MVKNNLMVTRPCLVMAKGTLLSRQSKLATFKDLNQLVDQEGNPGTRVILYKSYLVFPRTESQGHLDKGTLSVKTLKAPKPL